MSFKFHTFTQKKFSAKDFLSKVKENNSQKEQFNNNIRSIQLTNDIEYNKTIKKKLLEKNLEDDLSSIKKNNDDEDKKIVESESKDIKEIVLLMLSFNCYLSDEEKIDNYERSKNDLEFSNIISCFQLIIKFLYELKENNESQNNLMEKTLSYDYDKLLLKKNETIHKKNEEINRLENKKIKLQTFLNKYGNEKDIKPKKRFYVCDVCPFPYQQFYSYREFHKHYVKNHINPYLVLNNDYTILNKDFDKLYFDNKLNELTEDVTRFVKEATIKDNKNKFHFLKDDMGSQKNKINDNFLQSNNKGKNLNNNSIDFNEKRKEMIKKRIEYIENNQKNFENNFRIQINSFLEEIKKEISKIKSNQLSK